MTLPNVNVTITDGALGVAPANVDAIRAGVGCCSAGTVGQVYSFTNPQDVPGTLGYGPLAEWAAFQLQNGGGTVYAVRATSATAGAAGSVAHVGTGDGVVAVSGAPYDRYDLIVKITTGGEAATAKFKYSLDGGDNWSQPITVPAGAPGTYAIDNTGITLQFTDGVLAASYVVDDTYSFACTAPEFDTTGLATALTALRADSSKEWRFVYIVGNSTPYSGGNTTYAPATTVDSQMTSAEAQYRYSYAVCEARDQGQGVADASEAAWMTSLTSGLTNFASKRVAIVGGAAKMTSAIPLTGKGTMRRNVGWAIMAQRPKLKVSQDSGFFAVTGALPGVVSLYHDEQTAPGLDDARFTTARTITGVSGYFATHVRMFSPTGSDFRYVQHREVMDRVCRAARSGMLAFLNGDFRADPTNGHLDERDAMSIEGYVDAVIDADIGDNVSSANVDVIESDNVLSTETVRATIRCVPKAYAKTLSLDVGFMNPALAPAAA